MADQTRQKPAPSRRRYAPRLPPAQRREQLLDAALRLIAREGYGGASMEAVAREAGVTKPVVYDAFGGRGEMLRALLEREENRALQEGAWAIPALPQDRDPDELLTDGVLAFLRAVRAHPDPWRLILLPVDGTPDVVREHVERGRQAVLEQLEELVKWGLERRGGPGLDPEIGAHVISAVAEQSARLVLTEPARFTPERLGTFIARLMAGLQRGG
jgi:AcrR family transcriptional regulator